ncbi:hypothetical protein KCU59_g130, partial [Aureobasidium melanogenum]
MLLSPVETATANPKTKRNAVLKLPLYGNFAIVLPFIRWFPDERAGPCMLWLRMDLPLMLQFSGRKRGAVLFYLTPLELADPSCQSHREIAAHYWDPSLCWYRFLFSFAATLHALWILWLKIFSCRLIASLLCSHARFVGRPGHLMRFGRLTLDDYFLILAAACLIGDLAIQQHM